MPDNGEFRIIRNPRRRRIAMRIAPDGVLEIAAPPAVPENFLLRLLQSEHRAIDRLRAAFEQRPARSSCFVEGGQLMLLGKSYPLHLSRRLRIFDGTRFIVPNGSEDDIRNEIAKLYRELSEKFLIRRCNQLAGQIRLFPSAVRISSAGSRWGSCNSAKVIALSWKLLQCPLKLIDYVIIHELAHLKELNHSAKFWAVVAAFCPEHRTLRQELKRFSRTLPNL